MKLVRKSSHVEEAYIDTVPVTGHPLDGREIAHFQYEGTEEFLKSTSQMGVWRNHEVW